MADITRQVALQPGSDVCQLGGLVAEPPECAELFYIPADVQGFISSSELNRIQTSRSESVLISSCSGDAA